MKERRLKALGVWMGFDYPLSIKREGVGRFVFYLVKGLLKNSPVRCEIWCYSCNYAEVRGIFSPLEQDALYRGRITIITEEDFSIVNASRWAKFRNAIKDIAGIIRGKGIGWKQPYQTYSELYGISAGKKTEQVNGPFPLRNLFLLPIDVIWGGFFLAAGFLAKGLKKKLLRSRYQSLDEIKNDKLALYANENSHAECFLIPIVTLYNALELKKRKLYTVHDLAPLAFSRSFSGARSWLDAWLTEYRKKIDALAEQDSFLCSNSDYVRTNHALKFIRNVKEENTAFVYLPANIPDGIHDRTLTLEETRSRYRLAATYIFYPTQIRPYKNILTLLKALKLLRDSGTALQLVLTGTFREVPDAESYVRENDLDALVLFTGDVPEVDLYSLHKYAEATVVPTLFEGGFPWQGLEALLMDTPAVMSKIPVTLERLRNEGLDPESCGLKLFDPTNEQALADKIADVLRDRQKSVKEQQIVKDKLFSYTWDHASLQYYEIFSKKVLALS